MRKHALSPPSARGLQTKTVLHGSARKIPDLPHQQHFTLPAPHLHAHAHAHIIHSLHKPLKCCPKAHQWGAEAINTSNSGLPWVLMQHFTSFFSPRPPFVLASHAGVQCYKKSEKVCVMTGGAVSVRNRSPHAKKVKPSIKISNYGLHVQTAAKRFFFLF